ncbi:hypothetical protein GZH53_00960 [Flavihumibacter sp. R14]|nr:hypothetical protein [Flavihumibacter soli]
MRYFKSKHLLIVVVLAGLIWMLKDSFTQPGASELKGNFREITFTRNENNTGPVVRVYAVSVADTLYREMISYGDLMPHTKYGTTTVYFFKTGQPAPTTVSADKPQIPQAFIMNCIGVYEKDGMSKVSFSKSLR